VDLLGTDAAGGCGNALVPASHLEFHRWAAMYPAGREPYTHARTHRTLAHPNTLYTLLPCISLPPKPYTLIMHPTP